MAFISRPAVLMGMIINGPLCLTNALILSQFQLALPFAQAAGSR